MRSRRMKPIAQHAGQVEQQAVQLYVAAQQAVVDAERQLQQLIDYRLEYSQNRVNMGLSALQLRDYQCFLEKLNLSIDQARQTIEQKKIHCTQQKLAWLKTRSRSQALDAVIEKYQQQEAQQEARIEQKEQDEHASRMVTARRGTAHGPQDS